MAGGLSSGTHLLCSPLRLGAGTPATPGQRTAASACPLLPTCSPAAAQPLPSWGSARLQAAQLPGWRRCTRAQPSGTRPCRARTGGAPRLLHLPGAPLPDPLPGPWILSRPQLACRAGAAAPGAPLSYGSCAASGRRLLQLLRAGVQPRQPMLACMPPPKLLRAHGAVLPVPGWVVRDAGPAAALGSSPTRRWRPRRGPCQSSIRQSSRTTPGSRCGARPAAFGRHAGSAGRAVQRLLVWPAAAAAAADLVVQPGPRMVVHAHGAEDPGCMELPCLAAPHLLSPALPRLVRHPGTRCAADGAAGRRCGWRPRSPRTSCTSAMCPSCGARSAGRRSWTSTSRVRPSTPQGPGSQARRPAAVVLHASMALQRAGWAHGALEQPACGTAGTQQAQALEPHRGGAAQA